MDFHEHGIDASGDTCRDAEPLECTRQSPLSPSPAPRAAVRDVKHHQVPELAQHWRGRSALDDEIVVAEADSALGDEIDSLPSAAIFSDPRDQYGASTPALSLLDVDTLCADTGRMTTRNRITQAR